jgi:Protein of unknown function (DUF2586)
MNGIKFIRQDGGLGRTLAGTDHISLLLMYGIVLAGEGNIDATSMEQALAQGLLPADKLFYYHINEFFRVAPGARLITSVVSGNATTYNEIKNIQNTKQGVIKRVGIWNGTQAFTTASITQLDNVCKELAEVNMPLCVYLSPKIERVDYATLVDTSTLAAENVSIVIGQDNSGYGVTSTGDAQCGIIGATLGAKARSQVHTSLAWVEKQNMVNGFYKDVVTNFFHPTRELDVLGFLGGNNYADFSPSQIDALDAKGYVFLRKHVSIAGSYFNHSRTATATTSDYAFSENVETMNKACREVYQDLLPKLGSPAYIDGATGYITIDSITSLEAIAETGLAQMQRDGELSAYSVQIDPNQALLSTSKLIVKVRIVPVGVLRQMEVNIGFTLKIKN